FAFTLSALGRVDVRTPDLLVGVAVCLNLGSLLVFFTFVQQFSSGLRPASLMRLVANRARPVIEQVYPLAFDPAQPEEDVAAVLPKSAPRLVPFAGRSGIVMAFSAENLLKLARDAEAVIELIPQVGDSLGGGDPLYRVYSEARPIPDAALRGCIALGAERTLQRSEEHT